MSLKEYITKRLIRGKERKVKVKAKTENGKRKESIELLHPKRPRAYTKHLTRKEAREIHKKRSARAKSMDEKKTSKIDTTERYAKYPGKFDYPEVDTKGQGKNIGKGYAWKKGQRAVASAKGVDVKAIVLPTNPNKWTQFKQKFRLKMFGVKRAQREIEIETSEQKMKKARTRGSPNAQYWEERYKIAKEINSNLDVIETKAQLPHVRSKYEIKERAVDIVETAQRDKREWAGYIETLDKGNIKQKKMKGFDDDGVSIAMTQYNPGSAYFPAYRGAKGDKVVLFHTHPERTRNMVQGTEIDKYYDSLVQKRKITPGRKDTEIFEISKNVDMLPSDADVQTHSYAPKQITFTPLGNVVSTQTQPGPVNRVEPRTRHLLDWAFVKSGIKKARTQKARKKAIKKFNNIVTEGMINMQSHNGVDVKVVEKGKKIRI